MRIWDIHPGYLNRQSLLGEHRELHGIVSIFINNKKGYSKHPETLRWFGHGWALRPRHRLLAAEMSLRGYVDRSPVGLRSNNELWPGAYIDAPQVQFDLLKQKYIGKEKGRIPLPESAQQLWSHHKYSVLARDPSIYKDIGRAAANMRPSQDFSELSEQLTLLLRKRPPDGGILDSLQHMWGYVSSLYTGSKRDIETWPLKKLLKETQKLALLKNEAYLMSSTALSELEAWM